MDKEQFKRSVGYYAVDEFVRSGMVVGLGTGTTARYVVERIGEKIKSGELRDIVGIPTSESTKRLAESFSIPLTTLDDRSDIAVAIDGADEIFQTSPLGPIFLVKGRGGALFREKLVEECARIFVVVADDSKLMLKGIGTSGALPVEIAQFCAHHTMKKINSCKGLPTGTRAQLRTDTCLPPPAEQSSIDTSCLLTRNGAAQQSPAYYVTDNGNYIVDLYLTEPLKDPNLFAAELSKIVGVVEHGLFLGMADTAVTVDEKGVLNVLRGSRNVPN